MSGPLARLLAAERRRERANLIRAALLAALVSGASVLLLGLSGWFITAAALAGAASTAGAHAFNYMLPSAAIRLLAIVRTGARYGEALTSHAAALGIMARVRPALFRAIAAAAPVRALAFTPGEASARLLNDAGVIELDLVRRSAVPGAAAALVAGAAVMLTGGWAAALSTALCFAAMLCAGERLARRIDVSRRRTQAANGELKACVGTLASAAPELRCYGLEGWAMAQAGAASAALADAQVARADAQALFALLNGVAMAVAATLALILAAPAGAAAAALAGLAAAMTIDGAAPLMRRLADRGETREAAARVEAVLALEAAGPVAAHIASAAPTLDFPFADDARLDPGDHILLAGPSGSGKTSVVERLVGLRPARPGLARIDGVDIACLAAVGLRGIFAWSPQDMPILAGTVRENLLLADPGAVETRLWQALHDAALDDRVRALPGGLDCWIGENGERLSGGERRRLSLARAYLADAPWLLLDEPTEGLDAASERIVAQRLRERLDRTGQGLLLVSHRDDFARACTGRVIEVARAAEMTGAPA